MSSRRSTRTPNNKWSRVAERSFREAGFIPLAQSESDHSNSLDINAGLQACAIRKDGGSQNEQRISTDSARVGPVYYGEIQESVDLDGKRSTANSYLKHARMKRRTKAGDCGDCNASDVGLDIWTGVHVHKVVFDISASDRGKCAVGGEKIARAIGVETSVGFVTARKEVVSSVPLLRPCL